MVRKAVPLLLHPHPEYPVCLAGPRAPQRPQRPPCRLPKLRPHQPRPRLWTCSAGLPVRLRADQHELRPRRHVRPPLRPRLEVISIYLVVLQEGLRALQHSPLCDPPRAPVPRLRPHQDALVGPNGAKSSSRATGSGNSSSMRNTKEAGGLSSTRILAFVVSDGTVKSPVFDSTRG